VRSSTSQKSLCISLVQSLAAALGNAQPAHAQIYVMGALLRHGSEEQKRELSPRIASGEVRLQAFGVTEPNAGLDTARIETFARRTNDGYVVRGRGVTDDKGPVFIVGYCYGGAMVWQAVGRLDGLAAGSSYYGGGVAAAADLTPRCPVICHFGRKDGHIPADEVKAKIAAAQPGVPAERADPADRSDPSSS